MANTEYLFPGVKPKCLQQRWVSSQIDQKNSVLRICEHYLEKEQHNKVWTISLPRNFPERVLGKPVVIAFEEPLVILQYITDKCKFLRFIFVDLSTKNVTLFEDGEKYFNRDFATICPVECMFNPGMSRVLFRLPQPIMSSRKWSKMLSTQINTKLTDNGRLYEIENLRCEGLRDRRNQAVIFDPRYHARIVHILVDLYGTICNIMTYDLDRRKTISQKELHLQHNKVSEDSSGDDDEYEQIENGYSYHFLVQCNGAYCRSGEILTLCCVMKNSGDHEDFSVKLYMISADSLQLLKFAEQSTQQLLLKVLDGHKQLIAPMFSSCDTCVSVWALEKGRSPRQLDLSTSLPKTINLQSLCRVTIRRSCQPHQLEKLGLPTKLYSYLMYRQNICM